MRPSETRKPGKLTFAFILAIASAYLLWSAYGIFGFAALSAPGAIPMAATFAMFATSVIVVVRSVRATPDRARKFRLEVLPLRIVLMMGTLLAYAIALKPLGLLPTSAVFLIGSIRLLGNRTWIFSLGVGMFSLVGIYLIFRIAFTVLMPTGIVPEGRILAWIRAVFAGGGI